MRSIKARFEQNKLHDFFGLAKMEIFGIRKMKGFIVLMLALALASSAVDALAHGDVTPHPVDTSSLNALGAEWIEPNPYRGNEKAISVGAVGYLHNCAGCHGLNAESGGVAPDLLKLDNDCLEMASKVKQASCMKDTDDYFKVITLRGKKNSEGRFTMPAYEGVFTQEAVWAVKAYIDSRTLEENSKKPH
jgi:cytochrome c-550 PedF